MLLPIFRAPLVGGTLLAPRLALRINTWCRRGIVRAITTATAVTMTAQQGTILLHIICVAPVLLLQLVTFLDPQAVLAGAG